MNRTDTSAWPCTIARSADVLGDGWNLLIIRQACLGIRRFDDFQRALGIGRNILTTRLNRLVAEGLLTRVEYQERPLRSRVPPHDEGPRRLPDPRRGVATQRAGRRPSSSADPAPRARRSCRPPPAPRPRCADGVPAHVTVLYPFRTELDEGTWTRWPPSPSPCRRSTDVPHDGPLPRRGPLPRPRAGGPFHELIARCAAFPDCPPTAALSGPAPPPDGRRRRRRTDRRGPRRRGAPACRSRPRSDRLTLIAGPPPGTVVRHSPWVSALCHRTSPGDLCGDTEALPGRGHGGERGSVAARAASMSASVWAAHRNQLCHGWK